MWHRTIKVDIFGDQIHTSLRLISTLPAMKKHLMEKSIASCPIIMMHGMVLWGMNVSMKSLRIIS